MKRKLLILSVLFLAVNLLPGKTVAQEKTAAPSKNDKAIQAAEDLFEAGEYQKAQTSLDKFKKKAFKKLGQQNPYTATYYLLTAKYNLTSGMLLDFESNMKSALTASIVNNQEKSLKNALMILDASELYILDGS